MSKDFFDEEFDKIERENPKQQNADDQKRRAIEDWYNNVPSGDPNPAEPEPKRGKKALFISLTCVAVVLALVLGWVLCYIFNGGSRSQSEKLLSSVKDGMDDYYYQDISSEEWQQAIAEAGTALMQSAGDQYCRLMTPQEYYDYTHTTVTSSTSTGEIFGISFSTVQGLGLYIYEVATDGSFYGILQEDDIIVKITDTKDKNGQPFLTEDGTTTAILCDYTKAQMENLITGIYSAKFHVLRDGEVFVTDNVERGKVGLQHPNPYSFIEYYVNNFNCNISVTNQNKAKHNTYELRNLAALPSNTAYIRIIDFMYYFKDATLQNPYEESNVVSAASELKELLPTLKSKGITRIVLDLKGNPGGSVDVVCNIAGMLITDTKLTSTEKGKVKNGSQYLISTLVPKNVLQTETWYRESSYTTYFNTPSLSGPCDIVVWTDGGSASASELLTGALLDYRTGFQIGTCTYGKGIAQTIQPLSYYGTITPIAGDNTTRYPWAMYFTFAAYKSPLGNNIHGVGYVPQDPYNNISDYSALWTATKTYWGI